MRTHIIIPDNLVKTIDRLVGPRSRSQFVVEAIEKELKKIARQQLAEKFSGRLSKNKLAGWTKGLTSGEWIEKMRSVDESKLKKQLS